MRPWTLALLFVASCRIGFDPTDPITPDLTGDGSTTGEGDSGATTPDALPALCANAITVQLGVRTLADTCAGMDLINAACGTTSTKEVVFKFVAPATASYTFRTYDAGTSNVTMGTGSLDAGCMVASGCSGLTGRQFTGGSVTYFVWEAGGGQCRPVEFLID